jgi:Helix-turn-helix domain
MTVRCNLSSPETKRRMKLSDAARYLGISAAKLSRLVSSGELSYSVDPLDRRRKLVLVADLDQLKKRSLLTREAD